MGIKKSNRSKPASLKAGRPPTVSKPKASVSAKTTRTVINKLHQINKQLVQAKAAGDHAKTIDLEQQIESLGGLPMYQQASIQGQSVERGGDSSLVLMQWLKDAGVVEPLKAAGRKLDLLEVGALSTRNACATSGVFNVQHIDLHSQADGILQQDFMERPLPGNDGEGKFHIISLSLVLNFVPDAPGRGEMLRRTCMFLERGQTAVDSEKLQAVFPALFLVLPAPCVTNSRYMDDERLTQLMASLGYALLQRKQTTKLVYYLWQLQSEPRKKAFTKKELRSGGNRNNFAIVLK